MLNEQIEEVRSRMTRLQKKLRDMDAEREALATEEERYRLLNEICQALDKLEQLGAAHLFWGKRGSTQDKTALLERARSTVADFTEKAQTIEQRRNQLQQEIDQQLAEIEALHEHLAEEQERQERAKYDFVIHREISPEPYRPTVMPWAEQDEDRQRFRKSMLASLLVALLLGILLGIWRLPLRDEADVEEIPERLVELVQRKKVQPPPKPVEQVKPEEKKPEEKKPKPTEPEKQQARAKAEQSGILAFKDTFSELMDDPAAQKLGAEANVTQRGQKAVGDSQRSIVVAQARQGSGGINTASISRNVGGTGKKVGGVAFSRVESSVGTDLAEADRPLSDGPGPSRTDEEIQIVFDRYKAALYRIYNRELRKDPTLRGKMVLRLTIEPNGTVSACSVDSSDLASNTLKTEVVARVKRFNFGPKEGVPKVTILYPIDFLPAT